MGQGQMEDAINDFSREKSDLMSTKQPTSPDTTDLQGKHDDIKNKREGIWCLLSIFKVAYWDRLTVTSLRMGFHSERAAAGQGLSGLNKWWLQVQSETSAGLHPDQNSACLWDHASVPAWIQLPGNTSCPPERCETDGPLSVAS